MITVTILFPILMQTEEKDIIPKVSENDIPFSNEICIYGGMVPCSSLFVVQDLIS